MSFAAIGKVALEVGKKIAAEVGKEAAKEAGKKMSTEVGKATVESVGKSEVAKLPKELAPVKETIGLPKQLSPESQVEKLKVGGSYGQLKDAGHDHGHIPPEEKHHMPAWEAMGETTKVEYTDCPALAMEVEDHRQTASWGNSLDAREYRAKQTELIKQGNFREALQMDIDDIHEKFGDKYDEGIAQMLEYVGKLEKAGDL
ncbi:MAG: hypothetical protein MR739_04205 [Spirochaetia bacterium]|nr:hypothetical protein [Spirochaetia bacterium]